MLLLDASIGNVKPCRENEDLGGGGEIEQPTGLSVRMIF